jgi:23S rRNA (guanosine2251-2'-O)-methyltransferase
MVPRQSPRHGQRGRGRVPPGGESRHPSGADRWVYGRHPVVAALANPERRWRRLAVLTGQEAEARTLVSAAVAAHRGAEDDPVRILEHHELSALLPPGAVHQGLALEVEPLASTDLDAVLLDIESKTGRCILVALDQVTDPHNVGAVLRSAAAFGAAAVLIPGHNAPPAAGALAKAASGALDRVPLVPVVNLARALDRLKHADFWVCGLDASAAQPLSKLDLGRRVAIVLGSEGGGMRRLVRERCDFLARLPTLPAQPTLNVSNAAAVALYELTRAAAPAEHASG